MRPELIDQVVIEWARACAEEHMHRPELFATRAVAVWLTCRQESSRAACPVPGSEPAETLPTREQPAALSPCLTADADPAVPAGAAGG